MKSMLFLGIFLWGVFSFVPGAADATAIDAISADAGATPGVDVPTTVSIDANATAAITSTAGAVDRAKWVRYLWKISYPVIHNVAENSLREKMPIESKNGSRSPYDKQTYLEAFARTLAGVAPWLALPDDDSEEGVLRKRMRVEVIRGLKNAVDPDAPDCMNFAEVAPPIVNTAYLVHAFLRAPEALWRPLDEVTKSRYIAAFKSLRNRTGAYNNWLVFTGLTEAFLLKLGEEADPFRIKMAVNKMKEWYAGDGWYSDGPKFSMDYYNSYVIHPMYVAMLEILAERDRAMKQELDRAVVRMVRYAEFCERIIGPTGEYPAVGRSVTYRTAAFQTLADVALRKWLPEQLTPQQVRCALTAVHERMYEGNQNFDAEGWLVLGFNGHQPEIADSYSSTGSLYMATLSFLPLGLPATDAFWTGAPAKWTSKKAWEGDAFLKDNKLKD